MSTEKTDTIILHHAREMRHAMTRQERHLWFDFLQSLPQTVRRQKVFGSYIADFYIASHKLVIELDGSQHFEDAGKDYDERRDAYLKSLGSRYFVTRIQMLTEIFEASAKTFCSI